MEQLIRELNDPANQAAPGRIQDIQKQIQQLQREKSAWQLGLDFLQHDEAVVRFYGALTLTIKINADWDNDQIGSDPGMKRYLLDALVHSYLRLTVLADVTFVLQKLCSTLAALFQKADCGWTFPVRHVLACILQNGYVEQEQLPPMSDLLTGASNSSTNRLISVVRLAATIAEDAGNHVMSSAENGYLNTRLGDNCGDTFHLFSFCLQRLGLRALQLDATAADHTHVSQLAQQGEYIELAKVAIQAIPYWIPSLKTSATHASKAEYQLSSRFATETVAAALASLEHDELAGTALGSLTSIQQSIPRLLTKADAQFPKSFAKSPVVHQWGAALLQGDFNPDAVLFVDFLEAIMGQVDVTSSQYLESDRYLDVLRTIQALLKCDGVAVVEDTVCQVILEMMSQIVEGHTDWVGESEADSFLQEFVRDACESCLTKVRLPVEEMSTETQTWDTDDRAKFQDFRYDVQDFFQSAFGVLGSALVGAIVGTIATPDSIDWPTFEASIFCLTAFVDIMSGDPEKYDGLITAVFDSNNWQEVIGLSSPVPDRARQTSIKFVSESTAFLQRHPQRLVPVLNFLFSALRLPASAGSASRAIYTLCDAQRSILIEALDDFLTSLSAISDLKGIERHRIYGGVAAIVQALPNEDVKIGPLTQILRLLEQVSTNFDEEGPNLNQGIDTLQTLAAVGRGLRAPADAPIDLETSETLPSTFWTDGPGSVIQKRALGVYKTALGASQQPLDNALLEASCDFVRSGFTEEHPSPFKFSAAVAVEIVTGQISLDSGNIDAVMACASSFLTSLRKNEVDRVLPHLIFPVVGCAQNIVREFHGSGQIVGGNFPAASLDFQTRLLYQWGEDFCAMAECQQVLDVFVELAQMVIADPDTLPRRSAASFFAALVEVSRPNYMFEERAKQNIGAVIQRQSSGVIALLLRMLGGECARSELDAITDPLRRYFQHQPMLAKPICREAIKDGSGVLSEKAFAATNIEQRRRFVGQLESLRGGKKTNEVVKEFWIACRGSGFGYIA